MATGDIIGVSEIQARLQSDEKLKADITPIIADTVATMRLQMRTLGFFDSGKTDKSFKTRFRNRFGFLEGVSILAQRSAFVLANVGRDYSWQTVAGRRQITSGTDNDDFIFPWIDRATERIADLVVENRADVVVNQSRILNKTVGK